MARKKWTADLTIKFLEGYERHPCLWDVHNKYYKNRDDRESAYQNLLELMDIEDFDISDVKAKIRAIRNTYALEIAKIRKSQHSGAADDELYKPKLPWFSIADRILHNVVHIREPRSLEIETQVQFEPVYSATNTQSITDDNVLSASLSDSSIDIKPSPRILPLNATSSKKVIKQNRKSSTDRALEELETIAHRLEEKSPREEENEFDCFGKLVACQLKKLPEPVALESIAYIQSYLVNQRLASNDKKSTVHQFAASPTSSSSYEC